MQPCHRPCEAAPEGIPRLDQGRVRSNLTTRILPAWPFRIDIQIPYAATTVVGSDTVFSIDCDNRPLHAGHPDANALEIEVRMGQQSRDVSDFSLRKIFPF